MTKSGTRCRGGGPAPDRHARRIRSPPAVRRQSAEGDHRPLGRRGVRTMLCFDPTRGIDIGTKHQIYELVRELAAAGAAVLSTPRNSRRSSSPAIGRSSCSVGGSWPRSPSTRPTSRRSCGPRTTCRLMSPCRRRSPRPNSRPRGRSGPRHGRTGRLRATDRATGPGVRMSAAVDTTREGADLASQARRWAQRNSWTLALLGLFAVILLITYLIQPSYGAAELQGLTIGAMPLAMAAVAQAIVVIAGVIDLSIDSMMALTSVTAAILSRTNLRGSRSPSSSGSWAGTDPGDDQRRPGRDHAGPRHRRDPGHVIRLGRCGPARPRPPGGASAVADASCVAARSSANGSPGRSSSCSSSVGSSGSPCGARRRAGPSMPSAATACRRSGAASRSDAPSSSPTPSAACLGPSADWP